MDVRNKRSKAVARGVAGSGGAGVGSGDVSLDSFERCEVILQKVLFAVAIFLQFATMVFMVVMKNRVEK